MIRMRFQLPEERGGEATPKCGLCPYARPMSFVKLRIMGTPSPGALNGLTVRLRV